MKLEPGMKMAMIRLRNLQQWAEVVISRAGLKYAYVNIGKGCEYKFNKQIFERPGDNRSHHPHTGFELHASIEDCKKEIRETTVRLKVQALCRGYEFKPSYEQCVEIAKIMNWSLE